MLTASVIVLTDKSVVMWSDALTRWRAKANVDAGALSDTTMDYNTVATSYQHLHPCSLLSISRNYSATDTPGRSPSCPLLLTLPTSLFHLRKKVKTLPSCL